MKKRFLIYGLIGWCLEIFWTGFGSLFLGDIRMSGKSYIWMFPIYGLAIFLEPVHDKIRSWPLVLRGGVYTVLILMTEYSTGWLLRQIIGVSPWDYGNNSFSINGLIRLDYSIVWFIVGILFEKLHDLLKRIVIVKTY